MACVPTLCEISYDSYSDLFDEDRFSTPFRISRDCTGKSRGYGIITGEYGNLGFEKLLPVQCHAITYCDYLRNYYIEQPIRKNGGKIRSPTLPSRTPARFTWCNPIEDEDATSQDNPTQVVQDQLSLPVHLKSSGGNERGEEPTYRKGSGKIVWVDALNSWVPYKKPVQDKTYVSFVNTPPIIEKCFTTVCRQHGPEEGRRVPRPCGRFQSHMQNFNDSPRQVGQANLRRAVALQNRNTSKKSPDGSTWKQNRKAYSTPLSNAESRRNRLPPRAPSAGPSFPQPNPLEDVRPAWRSPDTHEGDTLDADAERLELLIPSPDTAGDTDQSVNIKPSKTRDSDEGRSASFSPYYMEIPFLPPIASSSHSTVSPKTSTSPTTSISPHTSISPTTSLSFLTSISPIQTDTPISPCTPISPSTPIPSNQPILPPTPQNTPRDTSATSVSSEAVDSIPKLPSVSIQYVVSEQHPHPKSVHFPQVLATDVVELEPVSQTVPYRVVRQVEGETQQWGGERGPRGRTTATRARKARPRQEKPGEVVNGVADHTPPDKPDKRQMDSTSVPVNKQQVQTPPPQPPPRSRPQPASRNQTQSKKSSPRKPATSKPNRSPKKPNKVKPPPQQQKTARPTAKPTARPKKAPSELPVQEERPSPSHKTSQRRVSSDDKPQPLPISLPVVTAQPPPPSPPSVDSDGGSSEQLGKVRSPIKKRERVVSRRPCKTEEAASEHVSAAVQVEKSADWIYEEKVEEIHSQAEESVQVKLQETVLPAVNPCLPSSHSQTTISRVQLKLQAFRQPIENKKRWGLKKRDTSYEDELRKQELAEARRKRQAEMLERKRKKKFGQKMDEEGITGIPNFEDYGFLAKYCILSQTNLEMYKRAFQAVDDEQRGWLTGTEAMIALRGTNNRLTETEEEYLYRILEMTGYSITNGADFKLFSLLAALSQRIAALDEWMKNLIGQVDFKMLDMKMFKCKTLWECNVDRDTNKISLEQLMIELRAGGVSYEHECEVGEKLRHLVALDLLDFLTYVPLFIMIHESVVDNPLDDTREK